MEFLDLIESISVTDASERRLYGGEGRRARGIRTAPNYSARLTEALTLVQRVGEGSRHAALAFEEAMSTSDFPLLFGDVIDRAMVMAYREYPSAIEQVVRTTTVRDFRDVKRFALDGAEGELEKVGQLEEYPAAALDEQRDTYSVAKFGRRIPLAWETLVNDDLDAFRDMPARLGRAARRTEQRFISSLIWDANGPHASLYTSGHTNIINTTNGASDDNTPFSIAGLQDGLLVLASQTDTDGEPIYFETVYLVVPPALEIPARNVLNGTELRVTVAGGATGQEVQVANWMRNRVQLVVDPYAPLIITTGTRGNTSWALFGAPGDGRPAIEFARLRGHEEPEIWVKSPNAMRAGGGEVGPDQGDFDNDGIQYRVRKVHGGAQLNNTGGYRSTVASNGTSN